MSKIISTRRQILETLDRNDLCLLSLDGGGVRGLSSLYILKRIMFKLNYERSQLGLESLKPCQVFDMIGGTSTGGLIAIMLGRLQMDIDECIQDYNELTKAVFSEKLRSSRVNIRLQVHSRFDSTKLRNAIETVITRRGLPVDTLLNDHVFDRCKVFVCAAVKDLYSIRTLKSYDIPGQDSQPVTVMEAALATSAATGYFDPVEFDDRTWIDGAIGANNPALQVEREASDLWCPEDGDIKPRVKCFISIGTGDPGRKAVGDDLKQVFDTLKSVATETEATAAHVLSTWRSHYDHGKYFRFNVAQGLQDVGLAEWDRKGIIKEATESYLDDQAQKFLLRNCVKSLAIKKFGCKIETQETSLDTVKMANPPLRSHTRLNSRFIGRSESLEKIHTIFSRSPNVVERVAMYGLKGIGKTALAREYARIWKSQYYPEGTVYIYSASDSTVFASEYGSLCHPPNIHAAKEWLANKARRQK